MIKCALWIFISIFMSAGAALCTTESNFKGNLIVEADRYFLTPTGTTQKLEILVQSPIIKNRLHCLKHGDFITGIGFYLKNSQLEIHSIDYVGLMALIGTWRDNNEIYKFTDTRNFYYWNFAGKQAGFYGPFSYHYALSPYGENPDSCTWKVFVVNPSKVVLGSLEWSAEDQIHLEMYDPDTGEATSTKHLIRSGVNPKL